MYATAAANDDNASDDVFACVRACVYVRTCVCTRAHVCVLAVGEKSKALVQMINRATEYSI